MRYQYNVDIVGNCNLRCPSCPVGNAYGGARPKGLMGVDTFRAVMDKIARETPGDVTTIALYDWGEPTIHPELPEMIRIVHEHGMRASISSNLNVEKNLEPMIAADPHELKVSLSGYYEESYSRTHRTGKIEKVVENMRLLRRHIDLHGARTEVEIGFHVYRHNLLEDLPAMRALARELGFGIEPVVALLFPLEKQIGRAQSEHGEPVDGDAFELTPEDEELLDLLLVKPEESGEWFRSLSRFRRWRMSRDCKTRSKKTSIRVDGSVALCCVTYDPRFTVADSFLDTPHAEIQRRRDSHWLCGPCMANGLHRKPQGERHRVARVCAKGSPEEARAAFEELERTRPA